MAEDRRKPSEYPFYVATADTGTPVKGFDLITQAEAYNAVCNGKAEDLKLQTRYQVIVNEEG